MKKNMIALLLSAVIVAGSIGTTSVLAAETTAVEAAAVEETAEVGEATEDTADFEVEEAAEGAEEGETGDTAEVPVEDIQEITETVTTGEDAEPEETAVAEEVLDDVEGEEPTVDAVVEEGAAEDEDIQEEMTEETDRTALADANDGTWEEDAPFVFSFSFVFKDRSLLGSSYDENSDWFFYDSLLSHCASGFDDGNFYRDPQYKGVFTGRPKYALAQSDGNGLIEIEASDTEYTDLSKSYGLIVKYPIKEGFVPNSSSIITVNGEAVEWACDGEYVSFAFPVLVGGPGALNLSCGSDVKIAASQELSVTGSFHFTRFASVKSSNTAIADVYMGGYVDYTGTSIYIIGKKPGKTTLTIKGENGAVENVEVTVQSMLTTGSVTIDCNAKKNVGFKSWLTEDVCFSVDDYAISVANEKIVSVTMDDVYDRIKLEGKYPGKTTLTLTGLNGSTSTLTVTVKPALSTNTKTPSVIYGSNAIRGTTTPGAKVTAKIGTKTYTATANTSGNYVLKIPIVKIGTKISMKFAFGSDYYTRTITVKKSASKIETTYWTYRDSTKVIGKAAKVHAGDYIKVTINGKVYKKKITWNANSLNFTIKISKPGKYGIRMKTELYNKFDQRLAIENEYVYKSDTVYVGDTKETVKWLTGWNDPVKKNYYTYEEQWCYDWYGDSSYDAYLYFRNGKVTGWQIFE